MLTKKQQRLLLYINQRLQNGGVAPSFEEMKDFLGLHSKSGVHRLIKGLEERGFVKRLPHRARAMEIIKLPQDSKAQSKEIRNYEKLPRNVVQGNFPGSQLDKDGQESVSGAIELPLLG